MILSYIDESGDDGFPKYTTRNFILTCCYFDDEFFEENYNLILKFRKELKKKYNLPTGIEIHMRELIQNKKPYTGIGLSKSKRESIIDDVYNFISSKELKIRFVNISIDKLKIIREEFNILEFSLKMLVRRIENDIITNSKDKKFICISDKGRVKSMNRIVRKIKKIDYIKGVNKPIFKMVEDVFEKDSRDSVFIQLSDCVACLIQLYSQRNICNPNEEWSKKTKKVMTDQKVIDYTRLISNKFNLNASNTDFGIKSI